MGRNKPKKQRGPRKAETADRFELYEAAVQDPETEMEFVAEVYEEIRGREARVLREDFCGSGWAACEWAKRDPDNRSIGVDLDEEVLEWGRRRHWAALAADEQARVKLVHGDVLNTDTGPADITVAMNFSYWIFKERRQLLEYFRTVLRGLAQDGILVMDAYGGYEAFRDEYIEKRKCEGGFTYVWEQEDYDPVSGDYVCHISFRFPDGSAIKHAFSYHWRLWTLPEIRELLAEAGFRNVTVWWQGEDEDGEGDGEFEPVERGDADPAWICYLVAER
ncbi:MAG TPA: class I SAM-dependent methyltransferase [Gammaproteobacteria bacterium]